MKKLILLIALIAFSYDIVFSQGCLPEGITFLTQEEIDNFQTNYPGCTTIEGNVSITGYEINNLYGLSVLTSINGFLYVSVYNTLVNFSGLENLNSIGDYLMISSNGALTSFIGLENLVSTKELFIYLNSSLKSFNGLNNLNTIGGYVEIWLNDSLTNLSGLENLTSIGGFLEILHNNSLTSLTGLENIEPNSITSLTIQVNPNLNDCDIKSICGYLASTNCIFQINNNLSGCNNKEEILDDCANSIDVFGIKKDFTIFPNPASSFITINLNGGLSIEEAIIYNHLGQKALVAVPVNNTVDVSTLRPGIYFIEVATKEWRDRTKLIIE
jgi:hypothetical protein